MLPRPPYRVRCSPGTAISGDCLNTTVKGNLGTDNNHGSRPPTHPSSRRLSVCLPDVCVSAGFPLVQQQMLTRLRAASKRLVLVIISAGTVSLNTSEADAIVWAGCAQSLV